MWLVTFLDLILVYAMFFSDAIRSAVVLKYFLTNSVIGMRFIHMSSYIRFKVLRFSFAFGSSLAPSLLQILSIILYLNIWLIQSSAYSSGFLVLVRSSIGGSCLTPPAPIMVLQRRAYLFGSFFLGGCLFFSFFLLFLGLSQGEQQFPYVLDGFGVIFLVVFLPKNMFFAFPWFFLGKTAVSLRFGRIWRDFPWFSYGKTYSCP